MHTELNKRSDYQNLVQLIASSIENRKEGNYQLGWKLYPKLGWKLYPKLGWKQYPNQGWKQYPKLGGEN